MSPSVAALIPKKLSSRHHAMAALEAAGWCGQALQDAIGLTASRISIVRLSPLYQALLAQKREEFAVRVHVDRAAELNALWPDAIATKQEMILQRENLAVANAASDSVIDRVIPKRRPGETDENERVLRVVITREQEALIERGMAEVAAARARRAIDVTPAGEDDDGE